VALLFLSCNLWCLARHPLSDVQVFSYFPALVAMLEWFFGVVVHFWKRMFRIANSLTDDFQRFGHSFIFLFMGLARGEECHRAFLDFAHLCLALAADASSGHNIRPFRQKVIQKNVFFARTRPIRTEAQQMAGRTEQRP